MNSQSVYRYYYFKEVNHTICNSVLKSFCVSVSCTAVGGNNSLLQFECASVTPHRSARGLLFAQFCTTFWVPYSDVYYYYNYYYKWIVVFSFYPLDQTFWTIWWLKWKVLFLWVFMIKRQFSITFGRSFIVNWPFLLRFQSSCHAFKICLGNSFSRCSISIFSSGHVSSKLFVISCSFFLALISIALSVTKYLNGTQLQITVLDR